MNERCAVECYEKDEKGYKRKIFNMKIGSKIKMEEAIEILGEIV